MVWSTYGDEFLKGEKMKPRPFDTRSARFAFLLVCASERISTRMYDCASASALMHTRMSSNSCLCSISVTEHSIDFSLIPIRVLPLCYYSICVLYRRRITFDSCFSVRLSNFTKSIHLNRYEDKFYSKTIPIDIGLFHSDSFTVSLHANSNYLSMTCSARTMNHSRW